jgi:hypothetical protein
LAVVLVLLVVAGVFLLRLAKLEAQLEPRLAVAEPSLEYAVLGSIHNPGSKESPILMESYYVHVVVRNRGVTQIEHCRARIEAIKKTLVLNGESHHTVLSVPINLVSAGDHEIEKTIHPALEQRFDLANSTNRTSPDECRRSDRK